MVAIWLPVLALFVSFAVDFAHFFDYSRNLQNRADAAALAAGLQYGNTCAPTTPDPTAMAAIGKAAQRYSGPGSTSDLPYPYGTWTATQYNNVPNLQAGTLDRYHVVINGAGPWQPGQTSNGQWPGHSGTNASFANGTVCAASYPDDQGGATGPITDVWVTQDQLPLFFPSFLLGLFSPTINAHARVELQQGIGSDNIRPIAVRDEKNPGCVTVNFLTDDANHTLIKTMTLTQVGSSTVYSNAAAGGDPLDMSLASGANVIVQPVLGCGADAVAYDGSTNSGLNYINNFSAHSPTAGQAPALTTGGVTLGGSCVSDQYFSTQACTAAVTAHVVLPPGIQTSDETITARDMSTNNTVQLSLLSTQVNGRQNGIPPGGQLLVNSTAGFDPTGSITVNGTNFAYTAIDATHFTLTAGGSFANNAVVTQTGGTSWTSGLSGLAIGVQTGQHPIRIDYKQTAGSIGGTPCGNGSNACNGNLGIQQQAFGACNACDPPDDSDGVTALKLRFPGDPAGSSGRNAFSSSATPTLVVELTLTTLRFDTPSPSSPDVILRVGTSTDQATGLINCGQGPGANADSDAVTFGCPWYTSSACSTSGNPPDSDFCAPLIAYDASKHPNGKCDPELRETANPTYADCVETISGTRRSKIPLGVANRIISNGVCSPNNWIAYATNPSTYPLVNDPRAFTLIITQPADLTKNSIVPIETFATFYITGWDNTGSIPNCNPPPSQPGNDPWPGVGKSKQNGAVWGHWITYTDPNVITNGQFCDPTLFGVCGTVLTR